MSSQRYRSLRHRISVLKRRLPRADATGNYTDRQLDATLGFRLLAHAELESCLEDLASSTLRRGLEAYRVKGVVTRPVAAACSVYGRQFKKYAIGEVGDLDSQVEIAVTEHYRVINSSHGIRERNVLQLLLPVGVRLSDLDHKWLADMDSFGRRRGDTAHQSVGSQLLPDPVQERRDVTSLVDGLAPVDKLLTRLA